MTSFMTRLFGYFLPAKSEATQEVENCTETIAYWQEVAAESLGVIDGDDGTLPAADRHQAQLEYAEALEKVEIWKQSLKEWSEIVARQEARKRVVATDAEHRRGLRETKMRSAKWRVHKRRYGRWPDEDDTPAEPDVEFTKHW